MANPSPRPSRILRSSSARTALVLLTLAGLWSLACERSQPEKASAPPTGAAHRNRAGLVVVHGNGSVETKCVGFNEPSIAGYQLVERSTIPFTAEFYASQKSYAMC